MLNLNTLRTPGVYIDEVPVLPKSVVAVPTAIPAFIGYTEKGPGEPTKISSFEEYVEIFGGPDLNENPNIGIVIDEVHENGELTSRNISVEKSEYLPIHNLYYCMQLFFDNGGGDCYIVSADRYTSNATSGNTSSGDETTDSDTGGGDGTASGDGDSNGAPAIVIESDKLSAALSSVAKIDDVTIIAIPESIHLSTNDDSDNSNPIANLNSLFASAVKQAKELQDRFILIDVPQNNDDVKSDVEDAFQSNIDVGDTPQYAAAYYPYLKTTLKLSPEIIDRITYTKSNNGDSDDSDETSKSVGSIKEDLLKKQVTQQVQNISIVLPPSPAIAGIYARVDNDRGVWKAPANVSVASVSAPSIKITDKAQENMNIHPGGGKSVNAIRAFAGRGILVWGARTLDGNDNEWRYISVRRFFNFVEESIKKATYQFVFEPNDANTWNTIRAMIENFLTIQWNQGALQGAKAEQAFFVRVGLGQTMTALDILEGRLIVEIGMAVVRPAEFIILRFMHKLPEA